MPRELVEGAASPFGVVVGWRGEGGVQVASVVPEQRSMWWQVLGHDDDTTARLGLLVREVVEASHEAGDTDQGAGARLLNALDVTFGSKDGLYCDLDRGGCNRLIRTLRRARDHAFGRDE